MIVISDCIDVRGERTAQPRFEFGLERAIKRPTSQRRIYSIFAPPPQTYPVFEL